MSATAPSTEPVPDVPALESHPAYAVALATRRAMADDLARLDAELNGVRSVLASPAAFAGQPPDDARRLWDALTAQEQRLKAVIDAARLALAAFARDTLEPARLAAVEALLPAALAAWRPRFRKIAGALIGYQLAMAEAGPVAEALAAAGLWVPPLAVDHFFNSVEPRAEHRERAANMFHALARQGFFAPGEAATVLAGG